MKFKYKIQPYQTEAVESVVRVFDGQPNLGATLYQRDLGEIEPKPVTPQKAMFVLDEDESDASGFKNSDLAYLKNQRDSSFRIRHCARVGTILMFSRFAP